MSYTRKIHVKNVLVWKGRYETRARGPRMEGRGYTDRIQIESIFIYARIEHRMYTYRARRGERTTIRRLPCTVSRYCFPVNVECTDRCINMGTYKRACRFFFDRVKERKYYTSPIPCLYVRTYVRTCSPYQLCGSNVHDSALYRAALWDWALRCWGSVVGYTFLALACLVSN